MLRTLWLSSLGATALLGAAGGAAAAASSNWELMVWTGPLIVSVDTASIERRAARIIAHVMWDYAELQTDGATAAAPYNSMMGTIVFDCATLRFGGAGSVEYSGSGGEGEAVARYSIDPDSVPLGASQPGTIGRDLVTYVCSHAPPARG
ncbi:MAG TPA: surface-adhesin E family protein [Steroidobacteraceae bacterium]|nr:surface-adhesin E family protein [Steroidobacteraceae bacterium]